MWPFQRRPRRATAPPASREPITDRDCAFREFFVFRQVLFARGSVTRRPGETPACVLTLPAAPDGSGGAAELPVALEQDPVHASTPDQLNFHLSAPLPSAAATTKAIGGIGVSFQFAHGRLHCPAPSAAGVKSDAFLNSESGFWAAVHAAPGARVLEIGSRARSGISRRGLFPAGCRYTGFDIVAGENVDVVGDAHALSRYFAPESFDFAFSVSVWEHLAMPWVVSLELNTVLRTGGLAMINTHQSWPSHEEPWDFFRFSSFSWDALFNAATGFEIVDRGMGSPCVMCPSLFQAEVHDMHVEWHYGYLASRVVARKTGPSDLRWPVDPAQLQRVPYPH